MVFKKGKKNGDEDDVAADVAKPAKVTKEDKSRKKAEEKAKKQSQKEARQKEKEQAKEQAKQSGDKKSGKVPKTGKAGTVKPQKNKFLKGSRFVLFVGDEGTILLYLKNNVVQSRQFVPDASDSNLEELKTGLEADTKSPISIVIDSLDQTYVQQSLPPVSSMSVKKLMNRRLERDFGANDIKGAILLGRDTGGRKDWNFLMVSIEKSRQITAWLDFVYKLPNRFVGINLVSVETEIILRNLDRAMGVPKGGTGSKWKFFVSHNKVGGFRQVILRDGRLIFTRMAQPIGESTPEVIAGNIEQEILSTIEYMKRLAYDPQSGLDIYIVAGQAVKPLVDKNKFRVSNFTILTPYEIAQYLGIEGATQPTDQFGDVILAATISASPKHVLQLGTPESKRSDTLFTVQYSQRIAAALMMVGVVGYCGSIVSDIYTLYQASDELEDTKRHHQANLDNLRTDIKRQDLDVEKTGDIIELYQLLQQQKSSPTDFIGQIEAVIAPPIVVKSIEWTHDEKAGAAGAPPGKGKTQAVFILEFPEVNSIESWRTTSKKLMTDLKAAFKGFDISFTRVPSKYTETEKLDMTFDSPTPKPPVVNQSSEVQLTMKEL